MGGPQTSGSSDDDVVRLFVKSGVDGERIGACPFCHRVYMVVKIKAQYGLLKYEMVPSNPSKPPDELKRLGLKHLPAITHGDEGFDNEDDIITYLDDRFPGGGLKYDNPDADNACKDFFSKFCFYIKAVNQDATKLNHALEKLNAFLESSTPPVSPMAMSPVPKSPVSSTPTSPTFAVKSSLFSGASTPSSASPTPSMTASSTMSPSQSPGPSSPPPGVRTTIMPTSCTNWPAMVSGGPKLSSSNGSISNDSGAGSLNEEINENVWLCGPTISHLDCEVLPKLQHLRVAASTLKQYQIPTRLNGCWRYLHSAYTLPVFVDTCPCDQEIILHWHDRPETKKLSHKTHAEIAKEKPKYSFDVPVRASVVTVVEVE